MKDKKDVGVIVARFQVPTLTEGHKDLIQQVIDNSYRTIIVLGLSPVKCTFRNPLDFESRKQMVLDEFPEVTVLYIKDTYSDVNWSNQLDSMIKDVIGPGFSAYLYGSRDSFIKYYSGKYECIEIDQTVFVSGTDMRKLASRQVKSSSKFRKGVIWAVANRYQQCLPTVDAAIWKVDNGILKVLLGKRTSEPLYRFPGGFVPAGETYENTVIREVKEETDLDVTGPKYIKSFVIDDWRYKSEVDKITSSLFAVRYTGGTPKPGDDMDGELRWFVLNETTIYSVVTEHKPLMEAVIDNLLSDGE